MKIATWAQNTRRAGRLVLEYDETDEPSDDWDVHEGTEEELIRLADEFEARAHIESQRAAGAEAIFLLRRARAIRDGLGI